MEYWRGLPKESRKETVKGKDFNTLNRNLEAEKGKQTMCIYDCLKKRLRDKEKKYHRRQESVTVPTGDVGREFKP